MNITSKQNLRQGIKEMIKKNSVEECQYAGEKIKERLKAILDSTALRIACFISRKPEIDTNSIIEYLFSKDHSVYVPSWAKCGKMWMMPLSNVDEYHELLSKSPQYYYELYGHHIPMPPNPHQLKHAVIDICITPGLAFSTVTDASGKYARVGYGFGHYDRYFCEYQQEHGRLPLIIGVGHDEQLLNIPIITDPHDIHVDRLITPNNFC